MADKKVTIKIGGMEVERTYTEEMIATQKKRRAAVGVSSPEGGDPEPQPEPQPEPENPGDGDGGEGGSEVAAVKKTRTRKKPA